MLRQTAALRRHHVALVTVKVLFALVRGSYVLLEAASRGGHEVTVVAGDGALPVMHLDVELEASGGGGPVVTLVAGVLDQLVDGLLMDVQGPRRRCLHIVQYLYMVGNGVIRIRKSQEGIRQYL